MCLMNTSISVKPTAIDPLDINETDRILVNRVDPNVVLVSNIASMKYVLFYNRY